VLLSEYLAIKGISESSLKFCATAYINNGAIQILSTMSTRKIKTIVAINWKKYKKYNINSGRNLFESTE
jgi:hypothetical protein